MKPTLRFPGSRHLAVLAGILATGAGNAYAQDYRALETPKSPLVLAAQGSFYVGGETVTQNETELGIGGPTFPPGQVVINQMYVRYMRPQGRAKVPVVMVHGGMLSGKSYETTPDGRMGWDEYFVRKGHTVFVPDQVSRARSGFDGAVYNLVRAGNNQPTSQPSISKLSSETIWFRFRFGPNLGTAFPETKFPVRAAGEFAKQSVPSIFAPPVLANPNPTIAALSELASKADDLVVLTHSQSSVWGMDAFLSNPKGIRGSVLVEPQNCPAYTDQQVKALAKLPILIVFADHIEVAERRVGFDACQALSARINAAGGNSKFVHLPAVGIRGNSHMMMMDKNSLQIADLIVAWMERNVEKKRPHGHEKDSAMNDWD
jgi:hypothetical protein